jgi:threonine dehydratase
METIEQLRKSFPDFVKQTPLEWNKKLSEKYGANIWLKREDFQSVRSYKIRGAFARMSQLGLEEKERGVVCASAGNHAQGVALCCKEMKVKGKIYMPFTTPKQKVEMVKSFGENWVEIVVIGDTFDAAFDQALRNSEETKAIFIPPFDDEWVIKGQATIGLEIMDQLDESIDIVLAPVGGGGLAAGLCKVFSEKSPSTKVIGVEPSGAPSMTKAFTEGMPVKLEQIDTFVDGAAVKRVGNLNFEICKKNLNQIVLVDEGKVCSTLLNMYNLFGMVLEPAGTLALASLDSFSKEELQGKKIVVIVSGGNNDISRTEEIRERAMLYEGLKHYFLVRFPQRPGALKEFVSEVVGEKDDITYFQFSKKNNRENGPAVVGIELQQATDFNSLMVRLKNKQFPFEYLNENELLLQQLIN